MPTKRVPQYISRRPFTVLFLIGMATFLLLAARSEVNDQHIKANTARVERAVADQCQDRLAAAQSTNRVLDQLIAVNRANTSVPATEIRDRIALYAATKVPVLPC